MGVRLVKLIALAIVASGLVFCRQQNTVPYREYTSQGVYTTGVKFDKKIRTEWDLFGSFYHAYNNEVSVGKSQVFKDVEGMVRR